jgi:glycine cleavage system regulatory protein
MSSSLVLTVIGADQPGLVEALSEVVASHGGSWQGSRMARLAGQFAGILEVRVASERAAALEQALHALDSRGLKVIVADAASAEAAADPLVLGLELVGQDRPGIIKEISAALSAISVNVIELETRCSSAPMSGEMLFIARARLHHPRSRPVDQLRETLEKIAADLMVDISLDEHGG